MPPVDVGVFMVVGVKDAGASPLSERGPFPTGSLALTLTAAGALSYTIQIPVFPPLLLPLSHLQPPKLPPLTTRIYSETRWDNHVCTFPPLMMIRRS